MGGKLKGKEEERVGGVRNGKLSLNVEDGIDDYTDSVEGNIKGLLRLWVHVHE